MAAAAVAADIDSISSANGDNPDQLAGKSQAQEMDNSNPEAASTYLIKELRAISRARSLLFSLKISSLQLTA